VRSFNWILGIGVACVSAAPMLSLAEDAHIPAPYLATGADSPIAVYVAAAQATGEDTAAPLGDSVDNAALAELSGGTQIYQNTTLTGTVTSDTANQVITGDNVISGNSFQAEAGIPVVIQNSGANVLIQNATVLNVQFKQ
jgi:ethanolamine utilization protein EutQ (cupin superfamily)